MAKYSKDDILTKAAELAEMIASTEEVDFFKQAEAQINENEKVRRLINTIKGLQKQAVNLQHYGKEQAYKDVQAKIDALEQELDELPIVQQFKQSQVDVNDLLQIVASQVSNTVTDLIIESTNGDLLRGETGSKIQGSDGSCSC